MRVTSRIAIAAALAAGAAALASGCGSSSSTSPNSSSTSPPTTPRVAQNQSAPVTHVAGRKVDESCREVPETLARRLLAHTVLRGAKFTKLAAVEAAATPGYYYVSTTVEGSGARKHPLATWVTANLEGGAPIYSVDSFAALISTYGGAALKSPYLAITAPGAYASRVCVGGTHASHGLPAPAGGGNHSLIG